MPNEPNIAGGGAAPEPQPWGDRSPILASCIAYIAYYAVLGFHTPFFPVWLRARSLSETEIVWVMALPMILRFLVTPLVGRWADDAPDRRRLLAVLLSLTLVLAVALSQASRFWPILALTTLMMLVWQSVSPVIDATVVSLVRRGIARDFGRIRLWGSLSFAVIAVGGGFLLAAGGPDAVFRGFLVMIVLMLGCAALLPSAAPAEARAGAGPLNLAGRPELLVVFVAVALIFASQAALNSFSSVHWLALGYPDWSVGLLWTVGVIAEIAMFWLGPQALARFGPFGLLVIAAVGTAIRWLAMGVDPPILVTVLLQTLHAATLSASYLGLMAFVQRLVEEEAGARAQSVFVTLSGLMMAAATLAIGPIYRMLGGGAFAVSAVLPLLALALLFARRTALTRPRRPEPKGAA